VAAKDAGAEIYAMKTSARAGADVPKGLQDRGNSGVAGFGHCGQRAGITASSAEIQAAAPFDFPPPMLIRQHDGAVAANERNQLGEALHHRVEFLQDQAVVGAVSPIGSRLLWTRVRATRAVNHLNGGPLLPPSQIRRFMFHIKQMLTGVSLQLSGEFRGTRDMASDRQCELAAVLGKDCHSDARFV